MTTATAKHGVPDALVKDYIPGGCGRYISPALCHSRYLPGPTGARPKCNSVVVITGQETQLLASVK